MKWSVFVLVVDFLVLILVIDASRKADSAPNCIPKLESASAVSSTSVKLTWTLNLNSPACKRNGLLTGYKVAYKWLDGRILGVKYKDVSKHDKTATITGLDKYTKYFFQIQAITTKPGHDLWSNEITTKTKEDAPICSPRLTSAEAVSSTSIKLTWTPLPNTKCRNGVLRGYRIVYSHKKGTTQHQNISSSATTADVTGLDKYTKYSFQILSYTNKPGPLSNLMSTRTKEDAPDCAPTVTSVQAVSSTSIRVTLSPLRDSRQCRLNGVLRGYKVAYRLNRYRSRMKYQSVRDSGRTTTVVSGLDKYTEYIFQVLAYTVKDGPWSTPRVQRTSEDAPDCAPTVKSVQAVSSTSVRVTWSPLRDSGQCRLNGVLRGYKVVYRLNRQGSRMKYQDIRDSGRTTTVVTGLDKYTEYIFQVLAYTVKDGPWSKQITTRTMEDAPDCALNVTFVQAVSSTSIRVTWSPLRDRGQCRLNGVLRGYKVAYRLNRHGSRMKYQTVKDSSRTTTVVTGLDKYTEYSLKVLAYTVKNGPWSIVRSTTTKENAPSCSPTLKSVQALSSTSVRVTWSTLRDIGQCRLNGVLRGYKVAYRLNRQGSRIKYQNVRDSGRTTTVVTNLDKYTWYSFYVLAYTVKDGPWSTPRIRQRTSEDAPDCAPELTSVQAVSSTSINVTWSPLRDSRQCRLNGVLRGYKVAYRLNGHRIRMKYQNVRDSGRTTTVVTNLDKYTWYSFQVLAYTVKDGPWSNVRVKRTKEDVPEQFPVNKFSLKPVSSTSIKVKWQRPAQAVVHGRLTGYKIRYQPRRGSLKTVLDAGLVNEYTLTGLNKYTGYDIQIAVRNHKYTGPWSRSRYAVTLADAPDCAPTMASVQAVSSTSIRVTWSPLRDSRQCRLNGVLRGYKVAYRLNRYGSWWKYQDVRDSGSTTTVVSDLDKYTEYIFQVLAYTVKDGPLSNRMRTRTKEDYPSPLPYWWIGLRTISSTSVEVTWQPPSISFVNGRLVGYKIRYKPRGGSTTSIDVGLVTKHTLESLQKFTGYDIEIAVRNNKYTGPWNKARYAVTLADAPDCAPVIQSVQAESSTSVRVTWSPFRDSRQCRLNGILRSYKVAYRLNIRESTKKSLYIPASATTAVVNGLNKYTEYIFQVLAYTVKDGPLSKVIEKRTNEDKPDGAPQKVSVTKINITSYRVTWEPVPKDLRNGIITKYQVRLTLVKQGTISYNNTIIVNVSSQTPLQYVFHDLKPCAQYTVTVRGFTKIGPGPYNKLLDITTKKPGAPKDLNITFVSKKTGVLLTWKKPEGVNSILSYHIKQMGSKDYWQKFSDTKHYQSKETRLQIMNLIPDTDYKFLVHVTTVCGDSSTVDVTVKTERDHPIAPNVTAIQYCNNTGIVVNVTLWAVRKVHGEFSTYQVIVSRGPSKLLPKHTNSLYNYTTSIQRGLHYYIAAELPVKEINHSRVLTIGDGQVFNHTYANVPLEKGYQYFVYQRAVAYYMKETLHGKEALVAYIQVASGLQRLSDEQQSLNKTNNFP